MPARELSFEIVLQIGTVVDCISVEDGNDRVACLVRLFGQISVTEQGNQFGGVRNHLAQNLLASART